ncbi:primase homolog protein isoform X1 [Coffea arabica]|uniref:Primase homolog protein isoform X1 n=1 Tax=Coffea arabica TaxID=13443 RepID=A0A6P6W041_COFAR|nr:primase homolog protein-like isoform X1 [Coffea arabica]
MPLPSRTILHQDSITAIIPSVYSLNPFTSHQFKVQPLIYLASAAKPISRISLYNNGFRSISQRKTGAEFKDKNHEQEESSDYSELKQKLDEVGLNYYNSCSPGQYHLLFCPKCKGGRSSARSLSFHITLDRTSAIWRCFTAECGWAGQVIPGSWTNISGDNQFGKRQKLQPLGDELIAYFAGRMISKQTLEKNCVMQVAGQKDIIAFTYRRNGIIVGCKYRTMDKSFWQEKGTEKTLYGLDDIKEADEVIIVEGEIDKLSLEEAGISNCVSVPAGAPQTVSIKELPTLEKDTGFQYIWNCKKYLNKASRIIIATDADVSGDALAEELARRLGRERSKCWRVHWPKKDEINCFKDANEVLMNLGPNALRETIYSMQLHHMYLFNETIQGV